MKSTNLHAKKKKRSISPTRRIAFSFFIVIIIGAILLSKDFSNLIPDSKFIDHLFIATSATCVTGLVPFTVVEQYSLLGQIIVLILIQIGGLGFLTLLSVMYTWMKIKLSYTTKIVMQEALNQSSVDGISNYIRKVIKYTFSFEGIGALLLLPVMIPRFGPIKGIYYSIFHSISAFCNAGFDLLGSSSLMDYQSNLYVNLVIAGLIIAGGLGFIVWIELRHCIQNYNKRYKIFEFKRFINSFTLHTKIVLIATFILIFGGMFVILALEWNNPESIGNCGLGDKLLISFFQSVTLRTAGFATIDIGKLTTATKLFMSIVMFIGGSPTGTAGGIKTVTFVIVLLHMYALYKGQENVKIMRRMIDDQVVKRCFTIATVSFFIATSGLFVLSISEQLPFIDVLFEVYSAFATVGLTCGITSLLTNVGKIVIIILMFIGRIGPITMVLVFAKQYTMMKGKDIQYPTGDVLIG